MSLKENVRIKLLKIKAEQRFTQFSFAEAVGLSENAIGKIERGESSPTLETLEKIAIGLKIPIKTLFDFEKDSNENKGAIRKLSNYLETKNVEDIRLVQDVAVKILER